MNPFEPPGAMSLSQVARARVPDEEIDLLSPEPAIEIEHDDGTVTVSFGGMQKQRPEETNENWFRNLADELDDQVLAQIGSEVVEGVDADDTSRQPWLEDQARIIEMLGLRLEEPRTSASGDSGELAGMSTVKSPLLLESTLRFQANARGELLPSDGPMKVSVDSAGSTGSDEEAQQLEGGLNWYLTTRASEYYPDTIRMFLPLGYGGSGFKKVYRCPIRRRPVSESIDPVDLIVNNSATDLLNAFRVTHRIHMPKSTLKRMQIIGAYRDVLLGDETDSDQNPVDQVKADTQGVTLSAERPEDNPYLLYETYCELDVPGFEDADDKGKPTGLRLPWKVTVHKETREVLEIRRNWSPEDDLKLPRQVFVKYTFIEGMGFYGLGLGHLLGNTQRALTAMERLGIDNTMFANFPGFLVAKSATRQNTNEIRVAPGAGVAIDTQGGKIGDAVAELPYRDLSPAFMALMKAIEEGGQRIGGAAQLQVGEGKQDAPVGTTLALIEQATKIMDSVHKNLHAAQAQEFRLLVDLFREDPMSLWRGVKGTREDWDESRIIAALNRSDISPKADPNTPSNMHRLMKATALLQLTQQSGGLIDARASLKYALRIMGFNNIDELMPAPQPGAAQQPSIMDQAALAAAQARQVEANAKIAKVQVDKMKVQADAVIDTRRMELDANLKQQEIEGRERVAQLRRPVSPGLSPQVRHEP